MGKPLTGHGLLLAGGALGLQWLDYQRLARLHAGDLALFGVALVSLVSSPASSSACRRPAELAASFVAGPCHCL